MLLIKQKHYFFLLAFLLLPLSLRAAWSEPTQAPPGGNAALPVYTTGTGQTIDGTLHAGTPGSYATGLQGSGATNGVQGNSAANALYGELTTGGAGGNRAVYGSAVDAGGFGFFVKLNRAIHDAMVSQSQGRGTDFFGAFNQAVYFRKTVKQGIVRVAMEMDKTHNFQSPISNFQ